MFLKQNWGTAVLASFLCVCGRGGGGAFEGGGGGVLFAYDFYFYYFVRVIIVILFCKLSNMFDSTILC